MIEAFGLSLGTFFQLLTTLFSGGILAAILTFLVKWRALSLTAEATLRTHFGDELKRLTDNALESDSRHQACEDDKRALRKEIDQMHDEIRGLKRQIANKSADNLMILEGSNCPSDKAPHATKSAPRVRDIAIAAGPLKQAFPPIEGEMGK